MTRIKIFTSGWASSVEERVNEWLEEQGPAFKLIDIKFISTTVAGSCANYSAMVIYNNQEERKGGPRE